MNARLTRLIAEAGSSSHKPNEEILQLAAKALQDAGFRYRGKMQVTRSYGRGAEVYAPLGQLGGSSVFLEISPKWDNDGNAQPARIEVRRGGHQNLTILSGPEEIRELVKLLGAL